MITRLFARREMAATAAMLLLLSAGAGSADRIWWDGSRDEGDGPPGKLLSDNDGYWGECVLTGVEYEYETPVTNPADTWKNEKDTFGRRLLDGRPSGNWWVPVGVNTPPLVVALDFKRGCTFSEVDISTRSKRVGIKIECRDRGGDEWRVVLERSRDECPETMFHRLPLPDRPTGRHLRLSIGAEGITYVEEVIVWGEAEVSAETPEAIDPIVPPADETEIAFSSIPGIEKTAFSDAQFWEWQRGLGDAAKLPAVWSRVPTWDSITDRPLLPKAEETAHEVGLTMARNETECVALALTNTSCEEARTVEVALSPFRRAGGIAEGEVGIRGQLRVAGAIGSRHYGVNIGPLLQEDNLLGASLMKRYLTNGAGIRDFPRITLLPAGSAVLWLSVTSNGAEPGEYETRLACKGGPAVIVRAEVLDVTLPRPFVWLNTWSGCTSQFPFVYGEREEGEVAYKQSLGVTVWNGFPTPGSQAVLAREHGRTIHHRYALPSKYVHDGYANRIKPDELSDEDERAIAEHVRSLVREATELGLSYDDWYGELWDEPGQANGPLYGALAALVRKADPRVRIYCNPCFWVGNGVLGDDEVHAALSPWYREHIDISVPLYLLLNDRPRSWELFDAPRFVRAFYTVSTQSAKSERAAQVQLYRRQAWDAFRRGWNGWGFYSYYAPRGNPWNDTDKSWIEDRPDYLMVYPGPRGPLGTRQSEAVREGWEDFCLLTLLRECGAQAEVTTLLEAYESGEPPGELRLRALRAAAEPR